MVLPNDNPSCGTIGGIEYQEAEGSGGFVAGGGRARGQRTFFIDWKDRIEFSRQLTGFFTESIGDEETIRQEPATFPEYDALKCTTVTISGLGVMTKNVPNPKYEFALVEAIYEPIPDEDTEEERILKTQELDADVEILQFAPMSLKWTTSGVVIPKSIPNGRQIINIIHTVTENESATNRFTAVIAAIGKVNDGTTSKTTGKTFLGAVAGTLLYLGTRMRRATTADGNEPFQLIHRWKQRIILGAEVVGGGSATWNHYYDDATKKWDKLKDSKTGADYTPFASVNMFTLIAQ